MTIRLSDDAKQSMLEGRTGAFSNEAGQAFMNFDEIRLENNPEGHRPGVRAVFLLAGVEMFYSIADGPRLVGGDVLLRGIVGKTPITLSS